MGLIPPFPEVREQSPVWGSGNITPGSCWNFYAIWCHLVHFGDEPSLIQFHSYEQIFLSAEGALWQSARDLETLKGQRRDPQYIRGPYLENGRIHSLGYNRAPMGNSIWGIKWLQLTWPMTSVIGSLEKKVTHWTDSVLVWTQSCFDV